MDPELQKIVDAENERNRGERARIARRLLEALGRADPRVRQVILFGSDGGGTKNF